MTHLQVVLVKGWKASANWGFPKGKINETEPTSSCAIREVCYVRYLFHPSYRILAGAGRDWIQPSWPIRSCQRH